MKNKLIFLFSVILAATLFISIIINYEEIIQSVFNQKNNYCHTVIVDAGHGGFDGGASAPDGTVEKDINLAIAQNLRDFLTHFGFNVIMTRTEDTSTESENAKNNKKYSDLNNRLKYMNDNPDAIYVSIHMNKFTSTAANGAQVFYAHKIKNSDVLAQSIQDNIKNQLQNNNNRVIKQGTKNIYILKNATIPATIVECGFISNPQELKLLKDENYQRKMAFSIFCGIIDYHNSIRQ